MNAHRGKVGGVMIGAGTGFENLGRKPKGWLKRYFVTNIKFLKYLFEEIGKIK